MKTIRIFISSPGDVADERDRARQVVEQLRRRYARHFDLKAVLWEELPLQADMSFQQGIDLILSREQGVDIAILILWSRLGSPVGPFIRKPDGSSYRSGTEREFHLIMNARRQSGTDTPKILIYTRQDEASFDERLRGKPTDEKDQLIRQKKLVESFIQEEFVDKATGTNVRAYHSFDQPVAFSQRLRVHLQEVLDGLAGGVAGEPVWDVHQKGSPFRGLQAFDFEHSPVFFGREDEVLEVRRSLQNKAQEGCAFVLISGASGSGKSSLARAGVMPAVVEHELDSTVIGWRCAVCTPSQLEEDLCSGLARLLCSEGVLPEVRVSGDSVKVLAEGFAVAPKVTVDQSVRPALARAVHGKAGAVRLLLLVDQLEELFTHPAVNDEHITSFLQALEALARSGLIWVLATVRSDFYARCQRFPVLMRLKGGQGQYDLLPPGPAELQRIIAEPVWLAGLRYERKEGTAESLDQRILNDAVKHPEALPLLEYLLRELYERRTTEGLLTFAEYQQLGGVGGALGLRAEAVFLGLPSEVRAQLPEVLHALIKVSEEQEFSVTRQRTKLADITATPEKKTLVETFLRERLFIADQGPDGEAVVHVAHEALLQGWSRASQWARDNREFLRTRQRVSQACARWKAEQESDELLLPRGKQVAEAEAMLQTHGKWLNPDLAAYIKRSIAFANRQIWWLRAVAVGFAVLALLASLFWGRAHQQTLIAERQTRNAKQQTRIAEQQKQKAEEQTLLAQQQSRNSEARRLLTEATHIMNDQPQEGLLLLVEAMNVHTRNRERPFVAVEQAFLTALTNFGGFALGGETTPITSVTTGPDARWLAAGGWNGSIRLWDLQSSDAIHAVRVLSGHSTGINALSISPNGRWLVSAAWDGTLGLWEFQGDAVLQSSQKLAGHQGGINAVVISKRSRWLATAGDDGASKIWDLQATNIPSSVRTLSYNHGAVNALGITSDERWLITGSDDGTVGISDLHVPDMKTGTKLLAGHSGPINAISISPDDHQIATANWDGTARLWSLNAEGNGEGMQVLRGHEHGVNVILHSPDGKRLVTGGSDGTVRVWSLQPGNEGKLQTLLLAHEKGWYTSFAGDTGGADTGAVAVHAKLKMTDLRNNADAEHAVRAYVRKATTLETYLRENLPLGIPTPPPAPMNLHVAAAEMDGQPLLVYDFTAGGVTAMTMSADSRWLITAGSDGIVQKWDLRSTDVLGSRGVLRGHEAWISGVAAASGDAYVASASWDGTIRLWALSGAGQSFKALHAHFDHLSQVINRIPDLVKAAEERSEDQQLARDLVVLARDVCARNLTRREWEKHFVGQPYRRTFEDLPEPSGSD